MTIEQMHKEMDKYCESIGKFICDGCRLRDADGICRWDYLGNTNTEDCYWFLINEGLIGKPEQPEIEFVKTERTERENILNTAKSYVCNDRNNQYGSPEDSFKVIADLWTSYIGNEITAKDVAAMMVLFKMARVRTGAGKADNWIDAAGYCACGGEIENAEVVYGKNT